MQTEKKRLLELYTERESLIRQREPFDRMIDAVSEGNFIVNKTVRKINERIHKINRLIEESEKSQF
jgi:hypothetical protein